MSNDEQEKQDASTYCSIALKRGSGIVYITLVYTGEEVEAPKPLRP